MKKKNNKTLIISAFPGCGKTHLFNNNETDIILDSDSSKYSWVKDESGENTKTRNPEFPNNYIKHIEENIGIADIILVSSHSNVRNALENSKIDYTIVSPDKDLKNEWLERFKNRGNQKDFIEFIDNNWDNFIDEIDNDPYPKKIKLNKQNGLYLDKTLISKIRN